MNLLIDNHRHAPDPTKEAAEAERLDPSEVLQLALGRASAAERTRFAEALAQHAGGQAVEATGTAAAGSPSRRIGLPALAFTGEVGQKKPRC